MKRPLTLVALVLALALPATASQFAEVSFDQIARGSALIVRAEVGQTWSAWDDSHEIIYTYATIRVRNYFADTTGPDTLVVREVGGTVGDYTQEAIGFPMLREGEQVVLFLSKWDEGSADFRMDHYNEGKYLVRNRNGQEVLVRDQETQGHARERDGRGFRPQANAVMEDDAPGLTMDEFTAMVSAARTGEGHERPRQK